MKKILAVFSIAMVFTMIMFFTTKSNQVIEENLYLDFDEAGLPVHVEI